MSGASPTASGTRRQRIRAAPGDVAIYGLSVGAGRRPRTWRLSPTTRPASRPDVVNGDGDRTGFSRVETGIDQLQVDVGQDEVHARRLRDPALEFSRSSGDGTRDA